MVRDRPSVSRRRRLTVGLQPRELISISAIAVGREADSGLLQAAAPPVLVVVVLNTPRFCMT